VTVSAVLFRLVVHLFLMAPEASDSGPRRCLHRAFLVTSRSGAGLVQIHSVGVIRRRFVATHAPGDGLTVVFFMTALAVQIRHRESWAFGVTIGAFALLMSDMREGDFPIDGVLTHRKNERALDGKDLLLHVIHHMAGCAVILRPLLGVVTALAVRDAEVH
jgi:hypothetical protein